MTPWKDKRVIGNATLYLGDCQEILPHLPKVDAVITDPPYGIAQVWKGGKGHGWANADAAKLVRNEWDEKPLDEHAVSLLLAAAGEHIIWGGNYFPLPRSRCWFVWSKPERGFTLAEAELAWTSKDSVVRVFDGPRSEPGREHPTQKPVSLMRWCVAKTKGAVCDPFMGSGTTGVACVELGRPFVGIEVHEPYFLLACKRIEDAQRQESLFPASHEPQQPVMSLLPETAQ
jgi:site-specific DNA-methyltransferase (adenine-specific)